MSAQDKFDSDFPSLEKAGRPQPKISPASSIHVLAAKSSASQPSVPMDNSHEPKTSRPQFSMKDLLNYDLLLAIPPQGPHSSATLLRPKARVTPLSATLSSRHRPLPGPSLAEPLPRSSSSPELDAFVVKRPCSTRTELLLDAGSDLVSPNPRRARRSQECSCGPQAHLNSTEYC